MITETEKEADEPKQVQREMIQQAPMPPASPSPPVKGSVSIDVGTKPSFKKKKSSKVRNGRPSNDPDGFDWNDVRASPEVSVPSTSKLISSQSGEVTILTTSSSSSSSSDVEGGQEALNNNNNNNKFVLSKKSSLKKTPKQVSVDSNHVVIIEDLDGFTAANTTKNQGKKNDGRKWHLRKGGGGGSNSRSNDDATFLMDASNRSNFDETEENDLFHDTFSFLMTCDYPCCSTGGNNGKQKPTKKGKEVEDMDAEEEDEEISLSQLTGKQRNERKLENVDPDAMYLPFVVGWFIVLLQGKKSHSLM